MTMMKINAGKYRHIVIFQRLLENRNTYGEIPKNTPTNWEDVLKARVGIYPLSQKDVMTARMLESELTHKIHMRYIPNFKIDTTMRIKFGERIFEIIAPPINFQEKGMEWQILCKERVD